MKDQLTIISVPNQRQIRVLMGSHILKPILKSSDIAIVAPFADEENFKIQFLKKGVSFIEWHEPLNKGLITNKLYDVSEMLRRYGYLFRHRHNDLFSYLLQNSVVKHQQGNRLLIFPLWKRAIYYLIWIFGTWSKAWRILDFIVAPKLFNNHKLIELSSKYSGITLIQSSSWGMQDRMLSWNARRYKWRKIMLPYTTDQLYMNGYLMSDFDVVCAQGPIEESYAKKFHSIDDSKIIQLGSSWLRMIDSIGYDKLKAANIEDKTKTIIYAGSQSEFFSIESEFQGLDLLLSAIKSKELGNIRIIYRPLLQSLDIQNRINSRYSNNSFIEIQYPDNYALGLDEFSGDLSLNASVLEHSKQLIGADLMIMCFITSLCIDAAYLGVPTISYCVDKTGYLEKRKTSLAYSGNWAGLDHIPHVVNDKDFISLVKQLLESQKLADENYQLTVKKWDFPKEFFDEGFIKAISHTD